MDQVLANPKTLHPVRREPARLDREFSRIWKIITVILAAAAVGMKFDSSLERGADRTAKLEQRVSDDEVLSRWMADEVFELAKGAGLKPSPPPTPAPRPRATP